jgi:hypothetical protein
MQAFFADLLNRLKEARPGITNATKTQPTSWWEFSGGRSGITFAWAFGRDVLRVELYIDIGDKDANKAAFSTLQEHQQEIEAQMGMTLNWARLENRKASRISVARPAKVTDSPGELEDAKQWALDTMLKFVDAFQGHIKALS